MANKKNQKIVNEKILFISTRNPFSGDIQAMLLEQKNLYII